jgi:hypothetical protein
LVAVWFAAITVVIAGSVIFGAAISVSTGALLLVVSLVPPSVVLLCFPPSPRGYP